MCADKMYGGVLYCRTMVTQLIQYERIETTLPKAKELKKVADKMITFGKEVQYMKCLGSVSKGLGQCCEKFGDCKKYV